MIGSAAAVPVYRPKIFLGLKGTIPVVSNADLIFLDVQYKQLCVPLIHQMQYIEFLRY